MNRGRQNVTFECPTAPQLTEIFAHAFGTFDCRANQPHNQSSQKSQIHARKERVSVSIKRLVILQINNGQMSFQMKIKYVVTSHSSSTEDCSFSPVNDFTDKGPNVWWGFVSNCKIIITQNDFRSEISEGNISFDPNTGTGIMTQRKEIAKAFNDYIAETYR